MKEERVSVQVEMVSHIRSQERGIVEGESQIVGKEIGFQLGKLWSEDSDIGFKQIWKKISFDLNYEVAVLTVFFFLYG